jgi:SAM-dependent methyltransferase
MTKGYYIDNVQLFKGFLIIEGWAFSGQTAAKASLSYGGVPVDSEFTAKDRPDVAAQFGDAPLRCGFTLRAIVTNIERPGEIELVLTAADEQYRIVRPGQAALESAHKPLALITDRFFQSVRAATDGVALEIGARARSGIVRRELFGDKVKYCGFDILDGENVDTVGDAHELSRHFPPKTFDFCYSVSVFEHLMWPWKVVLELNNVMKVGGLAFMQSHPTWPKHEMPWDFFRFWDSGWKALFCEATGFRVLETAEAHGVDLVPRGYTGNHPHLYWEGDYATLASAVLAEKISDPKVAWAASPDFGEFGKYPF